MGRFALYSLIIVGIEAGLTYGLAEVLGMRFLEIAFFTGAFFVGITYFFSSDGGVIANRTAASIMSSPDGFLGGFKEKRAFGNFSINPPIIGSLLFFISGIILATLFY